jgi:hypothetical protein
MMRMARTASPKIRPVKDPGNGKRYYIAYAHPYAFRDLKRVTSLVAPSTTPRRPGKPPSCSKAAT